MKDALSLADIHAAAERIAPVIARTPVLRSSSLDELAGGQLHFKCENFQHVGAFKMRGAANAVFALDDAVAARGVATHSSGNHGAALARAAKLRGVDCHVVVPAGANPVKVNAIRRLGANIIECEASMQGREQALAKLVAETGAEVIHPYADRQVMAGQGTVATELVEQLDAPLQVLVVPVGGGGLIAGCATAAKALLPDVHVIGVEPDGAADALASLQAGRVVPLERPDTLADGLRATVGEPNLAIIRQKVDEIVTVPDAAIIRAMRLLFERLKIVVEPSAAVGLAALLERSIPLHGRRAGIVLTGGNADLDHLPWLAESRR